MVNGRQSEEGENCHSEPKQRHPQGGGNPASERGAGSHQHREPSRQHSQVADRTEVGSNLLIL